MGVAQQKLVRNLLTIKWRAKGDDSHTDVLASRHVLRTAVSRREVLRVAKIDQLHHVVVAPYHHICWFQIAVNQVTRVQVVDASQQLFKDSPYSCRAHTLAMMIQNIQQTTSRYIFEDQVLHNREISALVPPTCASIMCPSIEPLRTKWPVPSTL